MALTLMLGLVSGCGAKAPAAVSPAPTAEPTPEAAAFVPAEAVTALECLHCSSGAYIAAVDATHIAVSWIDYDADVTSTAVVDIAADAVECRTDIDGVYYMDSCLYNGGRLALRDPDGTAFIVLDSALGTVAEFTAPCGGGKLSGDCSAYYYARSGALMRFDTASGESSCVVTALPVTAVYGIDPVTGRLSAAFSKDVYGTDTCTGVIDPETGELIALGSLQGMLDISGGKWFYTYYAESGDDSYSETLVYGDGERGLRADFDALTGKSCTLYWVPGSDFAFCMQNDYSVNGGDTGYWFYSLGDSVRGVALADYGIGAIAFGSAYLDGSGLVAASIFDLGLGEYVLYVIDPSQLVYSVEAAAETVESQPAIDETIISGYESELAGVPLDTSLSAVRERADALEAKYGIRILLSEECRVPSRNGDFEVLMTSEDPNIDEAAVLPIALDRIEEALALYPDGFFEQFRSPDGRGGICLMLIGSITSTYSVGGFQYDSGIWHCIELDVNCCYSFDSMLCHEIWHATENKINSDTPEADLVGAWADCNPAGVEYYYTYTPDSTDYSHTYSEGGARGDDIYFTDFYSKTNPKEDRARLMEYVMAYPYLACELLESPVMYAKYEVLCAAIRRSFDTGSWSDVWWERYLK